MKAFDLAVSLPWAIRPEALQSMLAIAARAEISPDVVAAAMTGGSPAAVAARLGRPLDNTHAVTNRDGVAVIPIDGPIFRRAGLFAEISGAVSTDTLATDLQTALSDPAVSAIALEIDSPGGEVAGTAELAEMIRAATAQKPVWAYVDHLGCSAAYWLAAAADRIVVAPTAILGSIGVVLAVSDPAQTKSRDIEFVSSQSPKKRADVSTEGGRAQVQSLVDSLGDVFVADVAKYRGVSTDTVLADFGQGDVFVGQAAVTAKLADAVGSFEQVLTDLANVATRRDGPTARVRSTAVGMRDKFFAWLDGLDSPEASAQKDQPVVTIKAIDKPVAAVIVTDVPDNATKFAELEAKATAAEALTATQAKALAEQGERIKAMEASARRTRFVAEVMGKSDANGQPWHGGADEHVAMLEHLAASVGEDHDMFKGYVTQQRALAEQMRSSALFGEIGSGASGSGGDNPSAKLTTMANQRVTEGKAKNFSAAVGQIERENPALFAEYQQHMLASSPRTSSKSTS